MIINRGNNRAHFRAIGAVLLALTASATGVVATVAAAPAIAARTADTTVEPAALQPPPPPGTTCRVDGPWTICHRESVGAWSNLPIFELACGRIYETAVEVRDTTRWYHDGKLVKRHTAQDAEAAWSLSPAGEEPTVDVSIHANWWIILDVPGDESTGSLTAHGNFATVRIPSGGADLHIAGLELPDGTFRGVMRFVDDQEAVATLCTALAP
jgi:hypothetical protein